MRRHWGPFLPAMEVSASDGPAQGYPIVCDLGSIRLIGASSACVTPLFSARGSLGKSQLSRLSRQLSNARSEGRMPLLAIHHPPLPDMTSWRKAVKEVQALQSLISSDPPALVCCGHLHHNIERTVGDSRIFCTASASNRFDASYRVFDIESADQADEPGWTIRMQLKSISGESAGKSDSFTVAAEKSWRFTL
jgi:Icc-related predicted phosphoesterase